MRILFCACHSYRHIDSSALARLAAGCRALGHQVTVVADLCRLGAASPPQLPEPCDWIVACHQRAVSSMFPDFPAERILNLRSGNFLEIAAALGIEPASTASPEVPDAAISKTDNWIPWFPVIDRHRCVNCRKCVDFCMFGVYSLDDADQVLVTSPANCKTDCPACARMCPSQAIIFPKSAEDIINGAVVAAPRTEAPSSIAGSLRARLQARQANLSSSSSPPLFKDDPT